MIKNEINDYIDQYYKWLKDNTTVDFIKDDMYEITTPYLDRHNDCLQIYATKCNGKICLTDGGYVLDDLISCGCQFESDKRKKILQSTVSGFGVNLRNGQLTVDCEADSFPRKKHDLIQAMLSVGDLFYLSKSHTQNLFFDDVATWFDENDVRYVPHVKFSGKSGFDHMFDFSIPKSKKYPERLVQAVTSSTKENATNLVFKWLDTKDVRPDASKLYVLLNDLYKPVSGSVKEAFSNYGINILLWSEKEDRKEELVS